MVVEHQCPNTVHCNSEKQTWPSFYCWELTLWDWQREMYIRARELTVIGSVCNNCVLHLKISLCKMETFYIFGSNTTFLYWNQISIVNECSLILFFPKALCWSNVVSLDSPLFCLFGSSVGIQPPVAYWRLRISNFLLSLHLQIADVFSVSWDRNSNCNWGIYQTRED